MMARLWRLVSATVNDVHVMRPIAALEPGDVLLCAARRAEARRLMELAEEAPHRATAEDIHKARVLAAAIAKAGALVVDGELPAEAVQPFGWRVAEAAEALARAARLGP